jgi:hypothetical protein
MEKSKGLTFFGCMFITAAALVWTGCENPAAKISGNTGIEEDTTENEDDNTDTGVPSTVAADPGDTADIALVPASKDVNTLGLTDPVVIVLSDAAAPAVTDGANATVNADTNHVTVTLTAADANIVAQGTSADGSLTFSGDYDFNLYLNGAGLTNAAGAAINNGFLPDRSGKRTDLTGYPNDIYKKRRIYGY